MTTVIFLFAVISTALACFRQPSLAHPSLTRPPPPATPSTTTAPTTLGVVIFVLKRAWSSNQSEVKKYVNDFNNELGLYAKKQGIPFERFGKPIPKEMSEKVTVRYNLKNIVCEEARPIFYKFSTDITPLNLIPP
ncbi:hypothetical protein ANCCAN_08841 [Ancylostoma caninum]|uniref:Uncharacterized protein n=1 Tax=Ancylostoma caninum TaxID=29170 RepID=A0A368GLC7_ANCCA|nr:hypothetical protein ANCCAN_08841 [Ancylostoma caninum]